MTKLEQQLAAALLDSEADAIVATDREGIIRYWNAGAERIFGHSADDAVGQSLDLIIPDALRGRHWAGYRRVMESGQSRYGRGDLLAVPGLRRDGTRISVEFTITIIRDADRRIAALAAVMRDVTARFEELRALRKQVGEQR